MYSCQRIINAHTLYRVSIWNIWGLCVLYLMWNEIFWESESKVYVSEYTEILLGRQNSVCGNNLYFSNIHTYVVGTSLNDTEL